MSITFPGHLYAGGGAPGQTPPQIMVLSAALAGGVMTAAAGPSGAGVGWQVYRITVQATSPHGGVGPAYVRVNGSVVEGTQDGAFDTDDTIHPIFVPAGSTIDVIWPQLTHADDVATARIEYLVVS